MKMTVQASSHDVGCQTRVCIQDRQRVILADALACAKCCPSSGEDGVQTGDPETDPHLKMSAEYDELYPKIVSGACQLYVPPGAVFDKWVLLCSMRASPCMWQQSFKSAANLIQANHLAD